MEDALQALPKKADLEAEDDWGFSGNLDLEREELSLNSAIPFAGRYILKKLLGSGGMGAVYLASDSMLGDDQVALKVLHSQLCQNDKHTKRFLREVQLTRKVTHPNVVRTFDAGRENGRLYFTMEFAEGVTLKEKLVNGPLEIDQLVLILREVAKGLYAIHQADIIHRDLKPGNVLLTPDGFIKITDFGVAKPGASDLTGHNEVIGSIPYMAPEVWVGRNVGAQADIYALGVLAYEMITGVLPFEGDSPAEMMCKHLESTPVPPIQMRPDTPAWLNEFVLKMLQKDQLNRPDGAEAVVKYINEVLEKGVPPPVQAAVPAVPPGPENESVEVVQSSFGLAAPPSIDAPLESVMGRVWAGRMAHEQPKYVEMPEHADEPDLSDFPHLSGMQRAGRHAAVFAGALSVCASLLWVFEHQISPWLAVTWLAAQQISTPSHVLFAVCSAFATHAVVFAMPLFLLAALRRSIRSASAVWLRAIGVMALLLVASFSMNMYSLWRATSAVNIPLSSSMVFESAEAALVNTAEIAILVPQGSVYRPVLKQKTYSLSENGAPSLMQMLPYGVLLALYLVYVVRTLEREVLTRRKRSWRFRRACLFAFGAAPIVAELCLLWSTQAAQQLFAIRNVQFGLAPLRHSFDRYSIVCAVLNCTLMAAAVLFIIPMWQAKMRRR